MELLANIVLRGDFTKKKRQQWDYIAGFSIGLLLVSESFMCVDHMQRLIAVE